MEDPTDRFAGSFWLAGNPRRKLKGFLDLKSRFPSLHLVGGYGGYGAFGDVVFHGRLATRRPPELTLLNCFGSTTSMGRREAETHIEATLVVFGGHFSDYESLQGIGIEFRLERVASWFGRKAFHFSKPDEKGRAFVKYTTNEEITTPINADMSMTAIYRAPFSVGGWGSERVTIARPLRLRLHSGSMRMYQNWHDAADRYRNLFSFLINDDLRIKDIALIVPSKKSEARRGLQWKSLAVTQSSAPEPQGTGPNESRSEPLIRYPAIKQRFPKLVADWFRVYESNSDSLESFFAGFAKASQPHHWEFLSAITAIEEMHRGSTGATNASLRNRLNEIMNRWRQLIRTPPSKQQLDQIIDSRNYYSHRDRRKRTKSAHGFLLTRYAYFLRALYTLELLVALDFRPVEVLGLVGSNYELNEALNLRAFPKP